MYTRTWLTSLISATLMLVTGCTTLVPEGTQLAQMDFTQFTEAVIAAGNPELAKRFRATRAAICHVTGNPENAPCVSSSSSALLSLRVSKEPDTRLIYAFDNWCAAHGGRSKLPLPSQMGRRAPGAMSQDEFSFSDFGTAVSHLRITGGQETSISQAKIPSGRQCFIGKSSVGLITVVMASGLNERGVYDKLVLALFYDEKDLIAFSESDQASRNGRGETK